MIFVLLKPAWYVDSPIMYVHIVRLMRNSQNCPNNKHTSGHCRHYPVRVIKPNQDRRGDMSKVYWMPVLRRKNTETKANLWKWAFQWTWNNTNPDRIWMTLLLLWTTVYMQIQMTFGKQNELILIIHNLSFWIQRCIGFIMTCFFISLKCHVCTY